MPFIQHERQQEIGMKSIKYSGCRLTKNPDLHRKRMLAEDDQYTPANDPRRRCNCLWLATKLFRPTWPASFTSYLLQRRKCSHFLRSAAAPG